MCHPVDLRAGAATVERDLALLDEREREHAAARHDDARRRYVVAHAALRRVLAPHLGVEPAAIVFERTCAVCGSREHGRPEVAPDFGLSFNLSHSGDVAVIAVAPERVGVDVELVRPRRSLERVAQRVLHDDEFAAWRALPDDERLAAFLRAWTAKEAYLKRLGVGIGHGLRDAPSQATHTWDWPAGCVTSVSSEAAVRFDRTAR